MTFADYYLLFALLVPCAFVSYLAHEIANAIHRYLND